jgi:hypothetical protein
MKVVTPIHIVILALLHQIQCVQVHFFTLATMEETSVSSDVQHPALHPECTSQEEVFSQRTKPAWLEPGITGQEISSATKFGGILYNARSLFE